MAADSVFLTMPKERWIGESEHYFLIWDNYPVSEGHLLIISKQLRTDFFGLSDEEAAELPVAIAKARKLIEANFTPNGYNIGMNCGEAAGQTVFHFHCHVIPRYDGDMDNPRGGVRHCISGKGYY